ncbi:E3 ubiquitin-protein ligase RNF25 [Epargyreus clarus]|uniref:E3 ubiquitin-protein ligase RNF25 n=1 Tax=Epargyreus clarus TaxID=520877 RepID=UPI003C2B1895
MTTAEERVCEEIGALEAILMDDVVVRRVDNVPKSLETVVHPSTGDDTEQQYVCVTLEVKLTPEYPDSSPVVILKNPRGLDDCVLASIHSQIFEKLSKSLGQPVLFELIELVRENITKSNLPSGQCVICLYGFANGDAFIKTQCYHYFHNHCLASHLIAGKKYHQEEREKLPNWQQAQFPQYQQTCPVCRSVLNCDVEVLKKAPPPIDSTNEPPFHLTDKMKQLQADMAAILARQRAKGGVVGSGDSGPPPLTITTPADNNATTPSRHVQASISGQGAAKEAGARNGLPASPDDAPGSPTARPEKVPYRGFNRRGKPGRRRGPR